MSWTDQWNRFFVNKLSVRLNKSCFLKTNLSRPVITNQHLTGEWKDYHTRSTVSNQSVFCPSHVYRYTQTRATLYVTLNKICPSSCKKHVSRHNPTYKHTVQMPSEDTHTFKCTQTHTQSYSTPVWSQLCLPGLEQIMGRSRLWDFEAVSDTVSARHLPLPKHTPLLALC